MKQKAIALILSAALALGSIGTAPILAAETTAQEAAPVEETASKEIEDNSKEEITETFEEESTQEETTEIVEEEPAQEETTETVVEESDESSGSENTEKTMEEEQIQEEENAPQEEISDTHNETITAPGTTETVSSDVAMSEVASGTCGTNLTWTLDEEGILTISGTGAMYGEENKNYSFDQLSVSQVIIENGVSEIAAGAFEDCYGLLKVILPESLTTIRDGAFYKCSSLTDINIPDSVTSLGVSVFEDCSSLQDIVIPNSVTYIGPGSFKNCYSLKSAKLSQNMSLLREELFSNCKSLSLVVIPKTITSIYYGVFDNCSSDLVIYGKTDTFVEQYAVREHITFIDPQNIKYATISEIDTKIYTGFPLTPIPVISIDGVVLNNSDYEIKYFNNVNVGTANVTITGVGDYEGIITKSFTIKPASIATSTLSGMTDKTYTGQAHIQSPTIKLEDKVLIYGTDYAITYSNNTNAGTATVTITGKGNYTGTKTATFKINKASQNIAIKVSATSITVGKTATVSVTGAVGAKSYKSSLATVAVVNAAGTITAKKTGSTTITATAAATENYNAASKTVSIKVVPAATSSITAANQATGIRLTWKSVAGATGYKVYRGSTLIKTIKGSTITCTDTKANANGTKYTFKIVPTSPTGDGLAKTMTTYRVARPAVSSVKNSASKKMTVRWNKNAKATGYQIQYSTNKKFVSGNKTANITKATTVSKVIGSLTKGKTYYVRIRTYKTVGKAKYWSAWSTAKPVKIRK